MIRILLLLLSVYVSYCWDKDAHDAIGMTTMSALKGKPATLLKTLMGGRDVSEISNWSAKLNRKYPWTTRLNDMSTKQWACVLPETNFGKCRSNTCLLPAVKLLYGTLSKRIDSSIIKQYDIPMMGTLKPSEADSTHLLIHLVGEMHQPMRFGFESDDNGRAIRLNYNGKNTTLFKLWETEIVQTLMRSNPSYWLGGWTHVNSIKSVYDQEKALFKEDPMKTFDKWATDTVKFMCENVYTLSRTGERLTDIKGVVLTQEDDNKMRELVKKQILLAGARVAIVLEDVLQGRESSSIKPGSKIGVTDEDETLKRRKQGKLSDYLTNFAINVVIMVFVLVALYILGRLMDKGSPSGPFKMGDKVKQKIDD
eukprot:GHVR01123862.1.p1 GENE.GHVR01123862.1~~GHVR01123862.1.p1  ORF type:complete len:377 (+),score=62.79 GHVR01123862.1:33-1133(+)